MSNGSNALSARKKLTVKRVDKLEELFMLQTRMQERLGTKPHHNQEFINVMTLAAIDELMEAIRETPWKPWKKQQTLNSEKFQKEIVDLWHFVINLSLAAGFNAESLHLGFLEKNKENNKRQDENY